MSISLGQTSRYNHDCKTCLFVGRYAEADLYVCVKNKRIVTVVARFSNEPTDFVSGLHSVALLRAGKIRIPDIDKQLVMLEEALFRAEIWGMRAHKRFFMQSRNVLLAGVLKRLDTSNPAFSRIRVCQ